MNHQFAPTMIEPASGPPSQADSGYAVAHIVCRRCFAVLDAGDRFCRRCGASCDSPEDAARRPAAGTSTAGKPAQPSSRPLTDNPWAVLGILFLVLGPLGLPLLWRSRAFGTLGKIVITVVLLGLCAVAVGIIAYAVSVAIEPLRELTNMAR